MPVPAFITENAPLAGLTTFRVGGAARYLARPANGEDVAAAFDFAARRSLPVLVLGGGSNLLIADDGVEAVVLRLSAEGEFGAIEAEAPGLWRVGAAAPLPALVAETIRRGRAGLESFAGIPGRAGGAAAMNAGSATIGIGTFVQEATVCSPDGARAVLDAAALGFSYRHSELRQGGRVALSFKMCFPDTAEPEALERAAREFRGKKRAAQPLDAPSAGCIFKNPPDARAGALLDAAGCKGMTDGGARVSGLHANFIVNDGGATAAGIARLAARMRERVRNACGVRLETEIITWGNVWENA